MRWAPAVGAVGYRIFVRDGGQPFGAGIDAGAAAPAADGSRRHVVSGLAGGAAYAFAVSAYDAAGSASGLSNELHLQIAATPTPTLSPSATQTATRTLPPATSTASATVSASPSPSPTASIAATATAPPTASATRTESASPLPSATPSATLAPSATPSPPPTDTATASATDTATAAPTDTATSTPSAAPTRTATAVPTATATASATASPTRSATRTATASATPTRTASATRTRTPSRTATFTPTSPPTATATPPATASATPTPTPTTTPLPARVVALPSGLRAPPGSDLLLPLTLDAGTAVSRLRLRVDVDPSVVALDDAALIDPDAGSLTVTRDATGLDLDVVLAAPQRAAATLITIRAVAVGACAESSALRLTACDLDDGAVACQPLDGSVALRCGVAGRIRHWASGAPVRAATVRLDGALPAETSTDALGQFAFNAMDSGAVRLAPAKQGDLGSALSALDAALVLRAAAGAGRLDALQTLACDATGNGTISALDAARILQVVVGQMARLPVADACGSDWAFVPTDAAGTMPPVVGGTCGSGAVDLELAGDAPPTQNFLAVPLGDCSGNWSGGAAALRRDSAARVWLGSPRPRPGGAWSVPLYARSAAAVMALDARLIAAGDAATRLTAVRPVGAARAAALRHAVIDDRIALASASGTPWTADGRPVAVLRFDAGPRPVVWLRGALVDEVAAHLGE